MSRFDVFRPYWWAFFGLTLGLLTPLSAGAAYERMTATVCKARSPVSYGYGVNTVRAMADNYDTSSPLSFVCPVPDTTDMPHQTINDIKVQGYDGCDDANCSVTAKLCAWNGDSGAGCGTFVLTKSDDVLPTDVGYFSMTISDYTALDDGTENAYLWVVLPKKDGSSTSRLSSLYFANPASLSTEAYFERTTAASCQAETPSSAHHYQVNTGSFELMNSNNVVGEFVCPIPDRTKLPKTSINTIKVEAYDGNDDANVYVSAKACAFNGATGTGGSCGTEDATSSSSTFVGNETLTPGTSALSDSIETPYLFISLPKFDATASAVKGMYFSKPAG